MKICLSCEGIAAVEQTNCGSCSTPLLEREAVHYPERRGEADSSNPLLGSVLDGKYRLVSVLGRGGMGVVFRAVHEVSLVPLAVKLLHPRYSQRPEYRRALIAEARQAGRVVHEGVARILDVGETAEGSVYLAMELAAGETLDACVHPGRPLPPPAAVEVLVQICRALVAIHATGLVHRDLSARNVMVAVQDGRASIKVLDFGIAKAAGMLLPADAEAALLRANPAFSAPEHLAGQDVDERADLYGFGVIAYLLLSGQLPVDSPDPREAARATLEGRLQPLPPQPGVPRRLQRLVARCLERDPERRPEGAAQVLAELEAVRGKGRALLPRLSIAAAAVAAVLAALAYGVARDPYLQLVPGGPLGALDGGGEVRHLQPERLSTLAFVHGGFDPQRLRVELARQGQYLSGFPLQPSVDGDRLLLATAQRGWDQALKGLLRSSEAGPVDLQFMAPGLLPFGSVRVRLDGELPQVRLQATASGDRLTAATRFAAEVADNVGVAACWLELLPGEDGAAQTVPLDPQRPIDIQTSLLAELLPGAGAHGPLQLRLWARDAAGNAQHSELQFPGADLAAPRVVEVTGPGGGAVLPFLGREASIELRWSEPENDLEVQVIGEGGAELDLRCEPASGDGVSQGVLKSRAEGGEPFVTDNYTFVVTDSAGNRSRSRLPLQFKSRRLDPRLEVLGALPGRAERIGDELVLDGRPLSLRLCCNDAFTAVGAELRLADATRQPLPLAAAAAGDCRLELPPLPPGRHRLSLLLEAAGGLSPPAPIDYWLRVLPDPVRVRIADNQHRFLEQLLDRGVFVREGDRLRDGEAFHLDPGLRPLLRGSVWIGGGPWTQLPLPDASAGDLHLLPPMQPSPGRNMLVLDLRDALGRPVLVECGGGPAPTLPIDGRELPLVADYFHDADGPQLLGEEVAVECDQPAVVALRTRLPLGPGDAAFVHLSFGNQGEVAASAISARPDAGATIVFRLPFASWSPAARLLQPQDGQSRVADLPRADYARGLQARLEVAVATPDGESRLSLPLRTVRTTLRPLPLGDLKPKGALPPAIADIVLVPVLAPEPPRWPDPVPEAAPGRELFRARPAADVGNVQDFLLQDREVTRAQYLAVLDEYFAVARAGGLQLWHADDPLGSGRVARAQLLPAVAPSAPLPADAAAMTGLDFFQVTCWCRLLSVLIGGDVELLRLPLGCELELAAFAGKPPGVSRNAAAARGAPIQLQPFVACAGWWDGRRPPPGATDCQRIGDEAPSGFDRPLFGLDFGVREWVYDLPRVADSAADELLSEWSADHESHLRHVRLQAGGGPARKQLLALAELGVVRGLACGELDGLIDPRGGGRVDATAQRLPAAVPGVVRCEQLRRDGRDLLPGRRNPILLRTGFRLAGDAALAALARRRGQ